MAWALPHTQVLVQGGQPGWQDRPPADRRGRSPEPVVSAHPTGPEPQPPLQVLPGAGSRESEGSSGELVRCLLSEGAAQTSQAGPGPGQGADAPRRCPRVPRDHSPTVLPCTEKPQGGVPSLCAPPLGYPLPGPHLASKAQLGPRGGCVWLVAESPSFLLSLPGTCPPCTTPPARTPLTAAAAAAPASPRPGPGVRTANRDWSRLRHGTRQPPCPGSCGHPSGQAPPGPGRSPRGRRERGGGRRRLGPGRSSLGARGNPRSRLHF